MTKRQFVYGLGQLLVERVKAEAAPAMMAAHAATGEDSQPMTVTEGTGASSYGVDIRTEGGSWNHLTGVTLDSANSFGLSFSRLAPGVTNWVRIKPEGVEGAVYSPAVRVVYNPDVTQDSSNQIQVISAGRSGTDVVLRWGLKNANGKKTRVYFRRADTGAVSLLTPQALNAGIKTLVLSNQVLTIPCGEFLLSQLETGGPESPLSSPLFFVGIDLGIGHEVGCGGGYPDPPETPPAVDLWSDYYHARDHLGNLRIVLEEAGSKVEAHDFYPFGQEDLAQGKPFGTASRRKFTGHERDEETGMDYMLARYYPASIERFLSVDPVVQVKKALFQPQRWNSYAYVMNNPVIFTDPTGETVYLIVHTVYDTAADDEFQRAAYTHAIALKKRKNFDPTKDKVLVRGVRTKEDLKKALKEAGDLEKTFGKIGEFSLFSHAGRYDGPTFKGGAQFTTKEIKDLKGNWATDASARFYGCRTALFFAQAFANSQGVRTYGFTGGADFSATEDHFTLKEEGGPLYLIQLKGGITRTLLGFSNDDAVPMVAKDPEQ